MTPSRIDVCAAPVDAVVATIEPYRDAERASWTCDLCEHVGDSAGPVAALTELLQHLRSCEAVQ